MTNEKEIVRCESPVRLYGVESEPILHTEFINGVKIFEEYQERKDIDTPDTLGDYKVIIEFSVDKTEELSDKMDVVKDLIQLLEKLWIYVTTYPLSQTDYSSYRIVIPNQTPHLWTSNYREVKQNLHKKHNTLNGEISIGKGTNWIVFSEFPLLKACLAIRSYETIDEATMYLIDLHHLYLVSEPDQRELFILAKALELVESMTEGKDKNTKSRALETALGDKMTLTLNDLLGISNNSRDIRHVVRKKSLNPKIHPKLSLQQISEYARNANIVIRYTVCKKLNISFEFFERK